jgi:outer membrane protein OmpA-like peptidoglycan-associated protein
VCGIGLPGERQAGLDADRDGVPDSDDWCAGTPAGARAGADGCADGEVPARCERAPPPPPLPEPFVDADGDGIADAADRCPDTPAGMAVIANGCVDVNQVVLKGTSFDPGSVTLLVEAHRTLRAVAMAMRANRRLVVEVGGHTDAVGDARGNQRLSRRRAEAIRLFLVSEGVDPARLSATGYGESRPIADNATAEGRAENRRVEFKVIRGGG